MLSGLKQRWDNREIPIETKAALLLNYKVHLVASLSQRWEACMMVTASGSGKLRV